MKRGRATQMYHSDGLNLKKKRKKLKQLFFIPSDGGALVKR